MEEKTRSAILGIAVLDAHTKKHRTKKVAAREFYALTYRFAGRVTVEADGVRVQSTPDTVTFTPSGMSYKTAVHEDTHFIAVHFRVCEPLSFKHPAVIQAAGTPLSSLFLQLKERYRTAAPFDFDCMSVFYKILYELEKLGGGTAAIPPCVQKAKLCIDSRFHDAELSIGDLSSLSGVSDSYLRRAFRRYLGLSPAQYLSSVRLSHAKELLESEYLSIREIAQKCGYHSTGYFIQAFREHEGISPGAYRKLL